MVQETTLTGTEGRVKRSHRSDGEEFYQHLSYTNDIDLNGKFAEWEHFYNFNRPHGAMQEGRTTTHTEAY